MKAKLSVRALGPRGWRWYLSVYEGERIHHNDSGWTSTRLGAIWGAKRELRNFKRTSRRNANPYVKVIDL